MTLLSGRLNVLLAMALAALLALGVVSAFAGPAPDDPGDVVTVDTGDGDTEGDTEGGDSGEVVCGIDGDTEGDTDDTGGDTEGDTDDTGGDTSGDTGDTSGDTECDVEGDTDVDTEGDDTADTASHDGDGPNPDRGCATGSLDHAREVLTALLERDHPGENEGIQNALDKMCHGFFAETAEGASGEATGESPSDPGNGHAFGRGHGHGKP